MVICRCQYLLLGLNHTEKQIAFCWANKFASKFSNKEAL